MPDPDIHDSKANSRKRTYEQFKPAGVLFKELDLEPPWKRQTRRQDTLLKEVDSAVPWKRRGLSRNEEMTKLDRIGHDIGSVSAPGVNAPNYSISSARITFKGVVDAATSPVHFASKGGPSFAR